jgi:hypothetical protein
MWGKEDPGDSKKTWAEPEDWAESRYSFASDGAAPAVRVMRMRGQKWTGELGLRLRPPPGEGDDVQAIVILHPAAQTGSGLRLSIERFAARATSSAARACSPVPSSGWRSASMHSTK